MKYAEERSKCTKYYNRFQDLINSQQQMTEESKISKQAIIEQLKTLDRLEKQHQQFTITIIPILPITKCKMLQQVILFFLFMMIIFFSNNIQIFCIFWNIWFLCMGCWRYHFVNLRILGQFFCVLFWFWAVIAYCFTMHNRNQVFLFYLLLNLQYYSLAPHFIVLYFIYFKRNLKRFFFSQTRKNIQMNRKKLINIYLGQFRQKQRIQNETQQQSERSICKLQIKQQQKQCCICLEETSEIRLDCGHIYHFECINNWVYVQNKCPTCRIAIY